LLKLEWWRYDLAPLKDQIDYGDLSKAIPALRDAVAQGVLALLAPPTYHVTRNAGSQLVFNRLS